MKLAYRRFANMSNLSCQTATFNSPDQRLIGFAASGQSRKDACFTVADPPTDAFGCLRWMGSTSASSTALRTHATFAKAMASSLFPDPFSHVAIEHQGCSTSKDSLFFPGMVVSRGIGPAFT